MIKVISLVATLMILGGCASYNEFASETQLYNHNLEARNYCKQISDSQEYYQCFDKFLLKSPTVTLNQLYTAQRSLEKAKNSSAALQPTA
ncbi:hypothetical protein [Vibrio barjaei]|jgi:hypothetical protein|uniref:Lipoprotein n=1 Tax=Vibrio barjaei TaxID=1676683 RepID=A0ABW7IJE3_9VIBR|nr:hypothetical protein [Vibrio barjaei]MCY9874114.1 hypothetical protein [Vibrio barjaei]